MWLLKLFENSISLLSRIVSYIGRLGGAFQASKKATSGVLRKDGCATVNWHVTTALKSTSRN